MQYVYVLKIKLVLFSLEFRKTDEPKLISIVMCKMDKLKDKTCRQTEEVCIDYNAVDISISFPKDPILVWKVTEK